MKLAMKQQDIPSKIESARKIIRKMKESPNTGYSLDFVSKLTENIDKLELIYSDVIVKEHKTQSAVSQMHDLEKDLEQLLKDTENSSFSI